MPSEEKLQKGLSDEKNVLSTAILETHYFYHRCFVENEFIIRNADILSELPMQILQGRYNFVTRRMHADKLANAINIARSAKGIPLLKVGITTGGHVISDEDNAMKAFEAIECMSDYAREFPAGTNGPDSY